jgi:CRISPR/Cas system CSM-associated protein Csm3 (group 7 of RAMP superfamily)
MKTAKLVKHGKGWRLEGKKSMPVPGDFGLTDDMEGQEVKFDNTGGPVKLICYQGKEYTKIQKYNRGSKQDNSGGGRHSNRGQQYSRGRHHGRGREQRDPARAPYNFVPLNEQIVSTISNTNHSIYSSLSGYVDVHIEALTPLLVKNNDGQFFRVNDTPFIPGSTCRGLIRSLVEIASYSRMSFFEDRQLYCRSNLTKDGNQVEGGFLVFSDGRFKVYQSQYRQEKGSNIRNPHVYKFEQTKCTFSTGKFGKRLTVWKFSSRESDSFNVPSKIIESYNSDDTRAEGVIDIFKSAKKDHICDKNGNVIKGNHNSRPSDSKGIPVFYRKDNSGKLTSIGHAKYHRIPYANSIGDHIVQNEVEIDFGNVIFGTDKVAGKVFFEDLMPISLQVKFELEEGMHPKILSSPKPTTYQHYVKQPNGIQTNQGKQHDWSTQDARIRGYKQYWHRKTSSNLNNPNTWIETGEKTNSHTNPINPVSIGSTFSGRIRFENLTEAELGALLIILDLPGGCAHKLGMGKPLGLGSVKITPSLTLIDRQKRYSALLDGNSVWESGESKEDDLKKFKDVFALYIGEKLQNPNITDEDSYWARDERMNELRHMLTLDHNHNMSTSRVDWNSRTRYMEIEHPQCQNEYRGKPVLPKPSEVVKPDAYTKS